MTLIKAESDSLKIAAKAIQEHGGCIKQKFFSDEAWATIKGLKLDASESGDFFSKAKQVVGKFFSIDEGWSWKRNLLGAFLVYLPEIPAYFIPSYTQAKNTGGAKDLKHGEGIRGLITGALEGLAVGAIVSGKKMSFEKIAPFALFGAVVQLFSSLTLPIIGEKVGAFAYNKRKYAEKLEEIIDIPFTGDQTQPTQLANPNSNQPQFKGAMPYAKPYSGSLKI